MNILDLPLLLSDRNMEQASNKYGEWALITGGSTGIGFAFAQQLAANGYNLVLVARNQGRLNEAQAQIQAKYPVEIRLLGLDLTANSATQDIQKATQDLDLGVAILNAGMETTGHFIKVRAQDHQKLLDLNVRSPMELAHLFAKRFAERHRGAIVLLSSLFGYQGVPLVAAYAASKAYVLSLGESLYVELKPLGVDVLVLSPGLTDTQMPQNMPVNFSRLPMPRMQPDAVARIALHALGKKPSVVPGLVNKIFAWENRLLPRIAPTRLFGFLLRWAFKPEQVSNYLVLPNARPSP